MEMKNDIERVEKMTVEMDVNDIAYSVMQNEYEELVEDIDGGDYDFIDEELDRAYFYKRVLSVLENEDIPVRASIGLIDRVTILDELYENKYDYIGESDTDEDIYKYVIEYGYRMYDRISHYGETPDEVFFEIVKELLLDYKEGVDAGEYD